MTAQAALFEIPVDERALDDVSRTVLEAIDRLGSITAREAGEIVYRFRGYVSLMSVPDPWLTSAGRPVLERLERYGLAHRRRSRWFRSDLIGPCVAPCARGSRRRLVGATAHTPCKSPLFRLMCSVAEILSRRLYGAGVEGYDWRRTAATVAGREPARLRDAQRGDDGWVRA